MKKVIKKRKTTFIVQNDSFDNMTINNSDRKSNNMMPTLLGTNFGVFKLKFKHLTHF